MPAALAIAGVILLSVGSPFMGGALVTSAGVAVMVGFFARLTIASNLQRDREEEARRAFRETGRWPGRRR